MATLTTISNGDSGDADTVMANFNALNAQLPVTSQTNGQLLIGSTGAKPVSASLTLSNGLVQTAGAGTLTVAPVRAIQWLGGF